MWRLTVRSYGSVRANSGGPRWRTYRVVPAKHARSSGELPRWASPNWSLNWVQPIWNLLREIRSSPEKDSKYINVMNSCGCGPRLAYPEVFCTNNLRSQSFVV